MDLLLIKCREEYNVEKLKRILEPYDIKISEKFEETGKLFEEQELMVHTDKVINKNFYVFNVNIPIEVLASAGHTVELSFDYIGVGENQEYTIPYVIYKCSDGIKFYIGCNSNEYDEICSVSFDKIYQLRNFYESNIDKVSKINDSDFFEAAELGIGLCNKLVIIHEI